MTEYMVGRVDQLIAEYLELRLCSDGTAVLSIIDMLLVDNAHIKQQINDESYNDAAFSTALATLRPIISRTFLFLKKTM